MIKWLAEKCSGITESCKHQSHRNKDGGKKKGCENDKKKKEWARERKREQIKKNKWGEKEEKENTKVENMKIREEKGKKKLTSKHGECGVYVFKEGWAVRSMHLSRDSYSAL